MGKKNVYSKGPMEIFEMKTTHTMAGGELFEDVFDTAAVDEVPNTVQRDPFSSLAQRETVMRLTAVEERMPCVADLLIRLERKIVSERINVTEWKGSFHRQCEGCQHQWDRVPLANVDLVAALRKANSDPKKFIRCLEGDVFKDEPHVTDIAVDQHHDSVGEMDFLRKCLFKFLDVATNLREDMWKRAKASLNSRARRARKAQRDVGEEGQEMSKCSRGTSNDAFDWDE
ncbi:unnamed protein product [Heligmosomoides polygyrus]|uniref:DUF4378 domain-containing protein n=1 Tax=Heligmosomoides polygyrus TaxID=6339 RepID=A0A183FWJ2_HELPZ|nr:unnamed protein product [Heligmosomoides polygyrus]